MTNNPLQINKTDTQLTIQFPHGEKIPFIHLLIHWLTLTIAVLSLFLFLFFLSRQGKLWLFCSLMLTYCFLPYYFFLFTPMAFLWNYLGRYYTALDSMGLRFSAWFKNSLFMFTNSLSNCHSEVPRGIFLSC